MKDVCFMQSGSLFESTALSLSNGVEFSVYMGTSS
jgi:hypothetical protein